MAGLCEHGPVGNVLHRWLETAARSPPRFWAISPVSCKMRCCLKGVSSQCQDAGSQSLKAAKSVRLWQMVETGLLARVIVGDSPFPAVAFSRQS